MEETQGDALQLGNDPSLATVLDLRVTSQILATEFARAGPLESLFLRLRCQTWQRTLRYALQLPK